MILVLKCSVACDHFAQQVRGYGMTFIPAAMRALSSYGWPGNVAELRQVVRAVSVQTDMIDVHHLPTEMLGGPSHRLTRIESMERSEIVRCLIEPCVTALPKRLSSVVHAGS